MNEAKQFLKRRLALLLAVLQVLMVFVAVPVMAVDADSGYESGSTEEGGSDMDDGGSTEENGTQTFYWSFENGKLTLSNMGLTAEWGESGETTVGNTPWEAYKDEIRYISIDKSPYVSGDILWEGIFAGYDAVKCVYVYYHEWDFDPEGGADKTAIPKDAFKGCTSLKSAYLDTAVIEDAFSGCTALTAVQIASSPDMTNAVFPDGAVLYGTGNSVKSYASAHGLTRKDACQWWTLCGTTLHIRTAPFMEMDDVAQPADMATVPWEAQKDNIYDVQVIGVALAEGTFAGWSNLQRASVSLDTVPKDLFKDCASLNAVDLLGVVTIQDAFFGCMALDRVTIEDHGSLETIVEGTFTGLPRLILEGSSEVLKTYAERNNLLLNVKRIYWTLTNGLLKITDYPDYEGDSNETTSDKTPWLERKDEIISVMGPTLNIPEGAFAGCQNLQTAEVYWPSKDMFKECTALTNVNIISGYNELFPNAFSGCNSLETVCVSEVYEIEEGTFVGLDVTVFSGWDCGQMKDYCETNNIPYKVGSPVYWKLEDGTSLTVSDRKIAGSELSSSSEQAWQSYKTAVTQVTVIGDMLSGSAFSDFVNLASVDLSQCSSTTIPDAAFKNCTSLEELVIPNGVTTINGMYSDRGYSALYGCANLKSLTLPASVGAILPKDNYDPETQTPLGTGKELTIKGYENSYAQTYAQTNNIPFEPIGTVDPGPVTPPVTEGLTDAEKAAAAAVQLDTPTNLSPDESSRVIFAFTPTETGYYTVAGRTDYSVWSNLRRDGVASISQTLTDQQHNYAVTAEKLEKGQTYYYIASLENTADAAITAIVSKSMLEAPSEYAWITQVTKGSTMDSPMSFVPWVKVTNELKMPWCGEPLDTAITQGSDIIALEPNGYGGVQIRGLKAGKSTVHVSGVCWGQQLGWDVAVTVIDLDAATPVSLGTKTEVPEVGGTAVVSFTPEETGYYAVSVALNASYPDPPSAEPWTGSLSCSENAEIAEGQIEPAFDENGNPNGTKITSVFLLGAGMTYHFSQMLPEDVSKASVLIARPVLAAPAYLTEEGLQIGYVGGTTAFFPVVVEQNTDMDLQLGNATVSVTAGSDVIQVERTPVGSYMITALKLGSAAIHVSGERFGQSMEYDIPVTVEIKPLDAGGEIFENPDGSTESFGEITGTFDKTADADKLEDGKVVLDVSTDPAGNPTEADKAQVYVAPETVKSLDNEPTVIKTPAAQVSFSADTMKKLAKDEDGIGLSLRVSVEEQPAAASVPAQVVVDVSLTRTILGESGIVDQEALPESSSRENGEIQVTIPYERKGDAPVVVYYKKGDTLTKVPSVYDETTKTVTFTTSHFSEYVIRTSCSTHSWDAGKVTKTATCTADGVKTYTCTVCGETKTETIKATGHKWDDGTVTKQPDVGRKGEKTYTCSVCGKKKTEEIEALVSTISFIDVQDSAEWYYNAVQWAVAKGVTNGIGQDINGNEIFFPTSPCTRAQAVTFLWRAAGQPEPASNNNPFADVPTDQYYYKAVLWAVEKGITNGISETEFSPDGEVTRGQMVTFLWRMHGEPAAVSSTFADVPASEYYYNAVSWAVSQGITNGTDEAANTFEPNTTCSRAHIVTFLYRDVVG